MPTNRMEQQRCLMHAATGAGSAAVRHFSRPSSWRLWTLPGDGNATDGVWSGLHARTGGEILWQYTSGGSCLSGAAICSGTVHWGSGYSDFGLGTPDNRLSAFGLPS